MSSQTKVVTVNGASAASILGISDKQVTALRDAGALRDFKPHANGARKHFSQYGLDELQALKARYADADALMRAFTGRGASRSAGKGSILAALARIEERLSAIEAKIK
jgi:hypothetical protein